MESWLQVLIGVGSLLTPVVIAAFARDRALLTMINSQSGQVNERINRVRDEFVRRDDLAEHLTRLDKQIDRLGEKIDQLITERSGKPGARRPSAVS